MTNENTTPSEESVSHTDLDEEQTSQVLQYAFKDFKALFDDNYTLNQFLTLLFVVRQKLENVTMRDFRAVVDGHKKHQWVCQKIHDNLRHNSALLLKKAAEEFMKAQEEKNNIPVGVDMSEGEDKSVVLPMPGVKS